MIGLELWNYFDLLLLFYLFTRVFIIKVFYLWPLRLIVPNVENLIRLTTL